MKQLKLCNILDDNDQRLKEQCPKLNVYLRMAVTTMKRENMAKK